MIVEGKCQCMDARRLPGRRPRTHPVSAAIIRTKSFGREQARRSIATNWPHHINHRPNPPNGAAPVAALDDQVGCLSYVALPAAAFSVSSRGLDVQGSAVLATRGTS